MNETQMTRVSAYALAKKLNLPASTVVSRLERNVDAADPPPQKYNKKPGKVSELNLEQVLEIQDSVLIHNERVRDIARRMRLDRTQIYRIADKAEIPIRRGHIRDEVKSLREIVENMKPAEALEYAIQAYENLAGRLTDESRELFAQLKLTPAQSAIFNMLHHRRETTVTKGEMLDNYYALMSEEKLPDIKIIDVLVCQIRKKIKGTQFRIETVWGVGYRLEEQTET